MLELMIVVAIIAILAAVVLPSYQSYVLKARRTDAKTALTSAAQAMERYASENASLGYAQAKVSDTDTDGKVVYKTTSESGHYDIRFAPNNLTNAAPASFDLRAIPKNAQASDSCGTFKLNQKGERDVQNTYGKTAQECWQ